jgi:hypothetical protein
VLRSAHAQRPGRANAELRSGCVSDDLKLGSTTHPRQDLVDTPKHAAFDQVIAAAQRRGVHQRELSAREGLGGCNSWLGGFLMGTIPRDLVAARDEASSRARKASMTAMKYSIVRPP